MESLHAVWLSCVKWFAPYYLHTAFFLLVQGIFILLGDKIDAHRLSIAKKCLAKFAKKMETLYGLSSCTFNVHQMVHLVDGVKHCGPLWATSAFTFEANNHVLIKMFSGTQHVPQQICNTFILSQKLPAIARECMDDDSNPRLVSLFKKLCGENMPLQNQHVLATHVTTLGNGKPITITAAQAVSLATMLDQDVPNRKATIYSRFVVKHVLYTSQSYRRSQRHHDYFVRISHPTAKYGIIDGLYSVKPDCCCSSSVLQLCTCIIYNVVFVKVLECTTSVLFTDHDCRVSCDFLREYTLSQRSLCIRPEQVLSKCIRMNLGDRNFICELPCRFYGD